MFTTHCAEAFPLFSRSFRKHLTPFFLKFYLFILERGREEKVRERNINVWLSLTCPLLATWPTTQACALTENQICDPLIHRPVLNPLNYASQGSFLLTWSSDLTPHREIWIGGF